MHLRSALSFTVAAAAAVAFGVSTVSPASAAQPEAGSTAAAIDSGVDAMIAGNPGAVKVSASKVRLANGVEATLSKVTPPRVGAARSSIPQADFGPDCEYLHTCIYDINGYEWSFYHCGFVNIGLSGWSDRMVENENNQTRGTWTMFYNWSGSSWDWVGGDQAYTDTGYIPENYGERSTDGVDVCGNAQPN